MKWYACPLLLFMLLLNAEIARAETLELRTGDHLCLIGNTLAERMQHDGWLETLLHARFPKHQLVIRNLGYSGDEITLRLRSMDFGTPDQWLAGNAPIPQPQKLTSTEHVRQNRFELAGTRADVIFAFFGYNESHAGEAGLAKFKQDLDAYLKHLLSQKYNGKSAPRVVLFSPIAQEDIGDRNLPDASDNNARLQLYSAAMREVAAAHQVRFVDLFNPSLELYKQGQLPLTINGIHLNARGNKQIARVIDTALFGPTDNRQPEELERLRRAVLDKNWHWYHRYRTTDGYSTYGDRAFLKFTDGQSNYEVAQRELEILDVMTANRDQRIWAIAQGADRPVDDSNTPPLIPVVTNKPGPLPGGKHVFLSGEEAISKMTVHQGMKVELFASEEQFPELINPVQMAFDTKGRLWVAAWPTYPHWQPKTEEMNDKLLILEDTDGDGRADKCTTFADKLHNPTGFEFWGGGVLVSMAPDLLFIKDIDGDDKADLRQRVLHGLDTADTHHTANSFTLDPGGALYFQEGTFHHSQVETPWGPPRRVANGAVFRYEPRAQKFDVYVSHGFANPHGHVFDKWGQDIVVDGTGAVPYHGALFSGHIDFPQKHNRPPTVYQQRTRPCPAIEYLSSSHFPGDMRGNLLVANVIGFQGILRYKVSDQDSSFGATELEPIVVSTDPNFRPVDLETAPDGSLYFVDWQNPIIGHMQHNLRDPGRDKTHGRVYRVTYAGRPLVKPLPIAGQPIGHLLDALQQPDDRVRYRARIELSGRPTDDVIAAAERWIAARDKTDSEYEHHLLEALWLHQSHNVVNTALLERMLESPDFRARAAAVRVLSYWRDRVSNGLDLLRRAAADEQGRVRLEAVRAASFYTVPEAAEVPIIASERPLDPYLEFVHKETMRTLEPVVKRATDAGQRIAFTTDSGARFFLRNISTEQLLKEERSRPVYFEMLYRPGLQDDHRREAIEGLARLEQKSELAVVMDAIRSLDQQQASADVSVIFDLVRQLTGRSASELATARGELEKLATSAKQPVFRQIAFVSLIQVDSNVEPAWKLAVTSGKSLHDFVSAMPLIADPGVRATLYDKIAPLLEGLPPSLAETTGKGTHGRYVRISLPAKGTLTLAEVEVYSNGQNVARRGRAIQKNTAHGGNAGRAIDGNKQGEFGAGGQTHTEENTGRPYWELDLGEEYPIERIVVYNRTDGDLGNRLNGFSLQLLDTSRNEVFAQHKLPAPKPSSTLELSGGGPEALVRRAAMNALTQVRGKELDTFHVLAKFVREDVDRLAAIRALQRIPRSAWPQDHAAELLAVLKEHVRQIPTADRTSPAALDALELADALTTLLPADQAKQERAELREIGVRVIRVGTIFERMSFDKDLLVVRAGKPVEFLLENTDLMPHNFVILQPGSLEEIGLLAEATAQQPDALRRQYVPRSDKVLLASNLLQPRDAQKLSFQAPTEPGVYPYVCTYPGHWRRMYGALYVVEDLDAYFENPEAYLAAHPLPIRDDLLKDRRPRTEWKLEELAPLVDHLDGRSFATGKQIFKVASCISCHKMEGEGAAIGPDLTQLDAKFHALDILKEVVDPSAKINEKFQSYTFLMDDGKVITGLVLEETPQRIKVIENPLVANKPTILAKANIEEQKKSPVSIMPKGLLDKLTRDEILDLIAYVTARGNKESPLFKTGGHQHH